MHSKRDLIIHAKDFLEKNRKKEVKFKDSTEERVKAMKVEDLHRKLMLKNGLQEGKATKKEKKITNFFACKKKETSFSYMQVVCWIGFQKKAARSIISQLITCNEYRNYSPQKQEGFGI